jgi:hypothetical protein
VAQFPGSEAATVVCASRKKSDSWFVGGWGITPTPGATTCARSGNVSIADGTGAM